MFSDILNNSRPRKYLYFFVLLGVFFWFICKNIDIAFMIFASIVFACSLSPLVDKLSKKMSRTKATTLILCAFLILISIIIIPILALGAYQIGSFAVHFPTYVENLDDVILANPIAQKFGVSNVNIETFTNSFAASSSDIISSIMDFVKGISSGFLYVFTSVIFLFFFIADKQVVKDSVIKLFPSEIREKTEEIVNNIGQKMGGYVIAQTLASASVWLVMTIGLLIAGNNYSILLGIIAGVLDIIPVVGPALALVICLIATYEAGLKALIIVSVIFGLAQFIENNFVRPYAYSKLLDLHPIVIFLSLFIGAKYLGVVGVLFAPPIATAICILFEELYVRKMN